MKTKNKKIITGIIVIVLIAIAIYTKNDSIIKYVEENYNIDLSIDVEEEINESNTNYPKVECEVVRVIDGDTIIVKYNDVDERVRMIGIDTPESVHPNESKNTSDGVKTSEYTKDRLSGKMVEIEFDVQQRDKYGRILAYVYIDGEMYNKELLELGYAKLATYPPNVRYVDEFTKIQEKARENKMGLWK